MNIHGLISFRIDWFVLLKSKGHSRVFSSTTVQKHQLFSTQLSSQSNSHIHYMTTGKTIALTRWTFVDKVLSLLFNMRSQSVQSLSRVQLFATPWSAAYQAPPSMGFSRQEYWNAVPLPSPKANKNEIYF